MSYLRVFLFPDRDENSSVFFFPSQSSRVVLFALHELFYTNTRVIHRTHLKPENMSNWETLQILTESPPSAQKPRSTEKFIHV